MDADVHNLCEKLTATSSISEELSTFKEHPRFAQYKSRQSSSSQNERRKQFLQAQKTRRYDAVMHVRGLAEGFTSVSKDSKGKADDASMDCDVVIEKPKRAYSDQLMLSEWLVEVPQDFSENYFMVPCPVGKRALIVSSRGRTRYYGRNGYCFAEGRSLLPGSTNSSRHEYTVLDGVVNGDTVHLLDILCWKKDPYLECETSFRFYWLQEKLKEIPDIELVSAENKLDGILFYHKQGHYIQGVCPLVGWLKGYMVPEVIPGTSVSERLLAQKTDVVPNSKRDRKRNSKDSQQQMDAV